MNKRGWSIFFLCLIGAVNDNYAFWSTDSKVNTPICIFNRAQMFPIAINDGNGGAIIAWYDYREGPATLYAQRIDYMGNPLWDINGIKIANAPPSVMSDDNSGGALIAWTKDGDGFAQRVDSGGNLLWGPSGVLICTANGNQGVYSIIGDGFGGAIIVWIDDRNLGTTSYDIYAQRVDSMGNVLWASDGVAICTEVNNEDKIVMITDDAGGAIIVWNDYRNGDGGDIYAQRVNANGIPLWTTNGIPICTFVGAQRAPRITKVESGLFIIAWEDNRNSFLTNADIYAQKIDVNGNTFWNTDGVSICSNAYAQNLPLIIADDAGGAIIAWLDGRTPIIGIYGQRVDSNGSIVWGFDGIPIVPFEDFNQLTLHFLVKDGSGGAIICYKFYIAAAQPSDDIYAQRIDSQGNPLWQEGGVEVTTANYRQTPYGAIEDMEGGAIIVFEDERSYINGPDNPSPDIYAQRISKDGLLGEMKELIVPWYNDIGSYSSFITVHNPSPETVTISVRYSGPGGLDATPTPSTFILGPASSKVGRPHQASGPGEPIEEGPPTSIPNSLAEAPFGSAVFSAFMPLGTSLEGDTLRMGTIPELGTFSGIAPAYSQ